MRFEDFTPDERLLLFQALEDELRMLLERSDPAAWLVPDEKFLCALRTKITKSKNLYEELGFLVRADLNH